MRNKGALRRPFVVAQLAKADARVRESLGCENPGSRQGYNQSFSMSYQVLARKYRPQRFSEVIGQEHVTRTLKNAI